MKSTMNQISNGEAPQSIEEIIREGLAGHAIVVLDDDPADIRLITEFFKVSFGFEEDVFAAANERGLGNTLDKIIETKKYHSIIIFSDTNLAGYHGYEIMQRILKDEKYNPTISLIIGRTNSDDSQKLIYAEWKKLADEWSADGHYPHNHPGKKPVQIVYRQKTFALPEDKFPQMLLDYVQGNAIRFYEE